MAKAPASAACRNVHTPVCSSRLHRFLLRNSGSTQTSCATRTTSDSFAISASTVMLLPKTVLEKPHCGLSASCSRGTYRLALVDALYRNFKPPFFWPELYRRTGGMSIVVLFDENPRLLYERRSTVSISRYISRNPRLG